MFREIRRKRQALGERECSKILEHGEWGVLGVQGDDGYPYTVPLNYVFSDGRLYFHCAREGHKIDAMRRCDKASFCVVDRDEVIPAEFTTYFRSVVVFGRLRIVEGQDARSRALAALVTSLSPNEPEESKRAEIERCWRLGSVEVLELVPEHISGKQARELMGASRA